MAPDEVAATLTSLAAVAEGITRTLARDDSPAELRVRVLLKLGGARRHLERAARLLTARGAGRR